MYKVILIIDDEKQVLDTMGRLLERCGHMIITTDNAEEGLTLLTSIRPDLIIVDNVMPVMNGLKFAEKVKKTLNKEVPILLHTGQEEIKSEYIDGVLLKPVLKDKLIKVVEYYTCERQTT